MRPDQRKQIVIVGGGFGGAYTAMHLGRLAPEDAEVTLVGRDNYFLMTPLLFEAGSGLLELRHAVNPVRPLLGTARFVNAAVERIDLAGRAVYTRSAAGDEHVLPYDLLVLALGAVTDKARIPGSEHALTYKTVRDAIVFRNHVIESFERADAEPDPAERRRGLTFVVVGGGQVGGELMGELTEFVRRLLRTYPRIDRTEVRLELLQHGLRLVPEMPKGLAEYAERLLRACGVTVQTGTGADRIEPGRVRLPGGEMIDAGTVLLATGLAPSPVIAALDLPKDCGRVVTDACMRVPGRPGVWALGDCAAVPGSDGKPYPTLAQHALRQAKRLSKNIDATLRRGEPQPFVYHALGTLAALSHYRGIGTVFRVPIWGFPAWWVWRSYYLLQMPQWERRLRIVLDWTVALFFRPDTVKVDLSAESDAALPPPARPPHRIEHDGVTADSAPPIRRAVSG